MDLSQFAFKNLPQIQASAITNHQKTRFFVLKSFSEDNISASLRHDVWATIRRNERLISEILDSGYNVLIFISVYGQSRFFGYALVTSHPGQCKLPKAIFQTADKKIFHGNHFDILWIRVIELPFADCLHLKNSLNNKSLVSSRDGQEVDATTGLELCSLFEGKLKRLATSVSSQVINSQEAAGNEESLEIACDYNPAIAIFPVDLSNLSYDNYIALYQTSAKYWIEAREEGNES